MLDRELVKEIKKANGNGNIEARFRLLRKIRKTSEYLSNVHSKQDFDRAFMIYGRVPVSICIAVTAVLQKDEQAEWIVDWGYNVLLYWNNRPRDISVALIRNMSYFSLELYSCSFVETTIE